MTYDTDMINEIIKDIDIFKENQNNLLNDIKNLDEKVRKIEANLTEKEEEVKSLRMELDSFNHAFNGQENYFESTINEAIRLGTVKK